MQQVNFLHVEMKYTCIYFIPGSSQDVSSFIMKTKWNKTTAANSNASKINFKNKVNCSILQYWSTENSLESPSTESVSCNIFKAL